MNSYFIPGKNGYSIPCLSTLNGTEQAVCLISHGFGSSKESPTAVLLLEHLPACGIGAVAFDFPAHGDNPSDDLRIETCLDDLGSVEAWTMAQAPQATLFYFSSSFGAYLNLIYLRTRPHLGQVSFLRSAAFCMPELFHHRTPEEEAQLNEHGFVLMDELCGYLRPIKLTRAFLEDLDTHDVFQLYHKGSAHLEMVHGEKDATIPLASAQKFATQFDIPLTILPNADHRLSIPGAPEEVLRLATAFYLKHMENT